VQIEPDVAQSTDDKPFSSDTQIYVCMCTQHCGVLSPNFFPLCEQKQDINEIF